MTEYIEVRTAVASRDHAQQIAEALVCKRLAASAQISGPIASAYWWKGEITHAEEWIVTAKTRQALYKEVEQAIKQLHPYEEPGIIAMPMTAGSASYFAWIAQETKRENPNIETNTEERKAQLIHEFDEAYEKLIQVATSITKQAMKLQEGQWGPREVLAHIAAWAVFTTQQIPQIAAGLPPVTYDSDIQHASVDDNFNTAMVTMLGDQSFEQIMQTTQKTHQDFVQMLRELDNNIFSPGNYVYERVKRVIDHHNQHTQELESLNLYSEVSIQH